MVDLSDELDLRRLERVVVSEIEVHHELSADEGRSLRSIDGDVPDHHVILGRSDSDAFNGLTRQVAKFLIHASFVNQKFEKLGDE